MKKRLLSIGSLAESELLQAMLSGPPESWLTAVREHTTQWYRAMHSDLATGRLDNLSDEDQLILREMRLEDAVDSDIANIVQGYRLQAVYGLSLIGTHKAIKALQEIRTTGDAELAREALETMNIIQSRQLE